MWKGFIRKRGITKTAKDLDISRQSVHSKLNDIAPLTKDEMKKLIVLAEGELSFPDFYRDGK